MLYIPESESGLIQLSKNKILHRKLTVVQPNNENKTNAYYLYISPKN